MKATHVTRMGDIWKLGPHRLDLRRLVVECQPCERLMQGEKAQMVFTDPPYNVPIDGHVGGLGQDTPTERTCHGFLAK